MARSRNLPANWAVMEHRAVQYRPTPMGVPFIPAVALIVVAAFSMAVMAQYVLTVLVVGSIFLVGKMLTEWHPFGWQITIKSLQIPKALWS